MTGESPVRPVAAHETEPLRPGSAVRPDWRLTEHRRGVFHDFYEFHLRYGAHPGCVYYLMPYLRETYGWDDEEALWFAFLNGNTQNPVTSLLIHRRAPLPRHAASAVEFWKANYTRLAWDTDRRYHKKSFDRTVESYLHLIGDEQANVWASVALDGWPGVWAWASSIDGFGRLSAFSYSEYLRIMGVDVSCRDLMLGDMPGSRSHRNGLCIVLGLDQYDWHDSNPTFDGHYPPDLLETLRLEGRLLLQEAQLRAAGKPWARDVDYFTLESALCTYKSWHRPNRRYPNVYNDMLHDRIRAAEETWPDEDLDVFWSARSDRLPPHLRLEDNPGDPGVHPVKQNWYRETGEVIMMDVEYPRYVNGFNAAVRAGDLGTFR